MSIFSRIKEAIFGDEGPVTPRAPAPAARQPAGRVMQELQKNGGKVPASLVA